MKEAENWANKVLEEDREYIKKVSKANFERLVLFGGGLTKDEELDMWIEHCKKKVGEMGLKDKTGMSLVDIMRPFSDLKNAELEKYKREAIKNLEK